MDVGGQLRHERTRQGLTLSQVAQSTKIHPSVLEAFENNDFRRLPANIYTRGFLRTYAKEIGLDPEETVEQYMAQLGDAPPTVVSTEHTSVQTVGVEDAATAGSSAAIFYGRRPPGPLLIGVVGVILLASYFAYASRPSRRPDPSTATAQSAAATTAAAAAASQPPAGTDAAAAVPAIPPGVLRVELVATGPCWVSVGPDGATPTGRLMQAGERQTIEPQNGFVLRLGDPSAMSVTINNAPAKPLGKPGSPVTVNITKQNFHEFLQPS